MKILVCGCGRIGSPLLTWLAYQNILLGGSNQVEVAGVDIDVNIINKKVSARFKEKKWDLYLSVLESKKITPIIYSYNEAAKLGVQDVIIITCGTPLDKNMNPDTSQVMGAAELLIQNGLINNNTLIIMRSTMFIGGTSWLRNMLNKDFGINPKIVTAPERIAEGYTFQEITRIPQIIGADDTVSLELASKFFKQIFGSDAIITLGPGAGGTKAAEIAKLMCNTWRYIGFSAANEFAILCDEANVDFSAVRHACNFDYWRCFIPKAALNVGGPCLGKDAQILGAYSKNAEITLSAYDTAEKTAIYFANKYKDKIKNGKVGVLGLAFKANSDNPTNSLSFKLIKYLEVLGADKIFVDDPNISHKYSVNNADTVIQKADIIFVMTEHDEYTELNFDNKNKTVIRL